MTNLTAVECMDGFEEKQGACNAIPKASSLQMILGVCLGLVLLAVASYFGFIASKNPKNFRRCLKLCIDFYDFYATVMLRTDLRCRVLVSLLSVEFLIAFTVSFGC